MVHIHRGCRSVLYVDRHTACIYTLGAHASTCVPITLMRAPLALPVRL